MSKRPTTKVRSKTAPGKSRPKSFKADGTPKKRWSASERSERGHAPRRSGGKPRVERDRFERSSEERRTPDRRGRSFAKVEPRQDRDFRDRDDRRDFRSRDDRRDFRDRDDRRTDRRDFRDRDDRRNFRDRDDRRTDRRDFRDRDDRRDFRSRDDRRDFRDRDDRRTDRRDFRDRDDRRDFRSRDDRRDFRDRDDRRDNRRDFRGQDDRRPRSKERFTGEKFGAGHHRDDRRRTERREQFRDEPRHDQLEELEHADTMSWEPTEATVTASAPVADQPEVDADAPGFGDLGLPEQLVSSLTRQGITTPFPIQAATIPDALEGKDVLGRGRTGSGKTLGFGLPLLTRLANTDADPNGRPGAVVLVPTRELALQVADVLAPLGKELGLSVTLVAGGMAFGPQIKAFDRGVDVVVATPGRLIDLMDQGVADLTQVKITVLDEADHMADLGFLPDVTTILDAIPTDGQRLLFSATLDRGIDRLVRAYLHDPVTHEVDAAKAAVNTMEHRVLHVLPHDKNAATAAIANREGRTVIFVRTQLGADRVAEQLRSAGVTAGALHGGLTQGARARILAAFKDGTLPVLVATDVAARGIHVDEVSLVLQVDPPMGPKDYLHRAGRTARAGGTGIVASIVLPHQRKQMRRITGQAGVKVEPVEVRPEGDLLTELTGARTPSGAPVTEEEYAKLVAPRREARGPKKRRPAWGRDSGDRQGGRGRGQDRRSGGPRGRTGHGSRGPRSREG
ncbi:DEAD/DEAH box helicase [Enemella evansiae]|uniref:DEAD/DEAH box helicase n=1 Tax=Enemella evansiae TaxID=2016499 RepID=UPI000B96DDAB|nr:DEAD/DEAH box helicase [Enemella evansiae]OYN95537.1 DEAD/DEAH box helicase [Enemella evansiae]